LRSFNILFYFTLYRIGSGSQSGTNIGPLINAAAVEKVERHILDATSKGAKLLYQNTNFPPSEGYFCAPSILTNMADTMTISKEETFGPVAAIFKFETEKEGMISNCIKLFIK
jgi:succinate-semialdehyde dehydrogenase / glutarate-semialdehyde dehydrogenase